jgi:hypothetical protein
MYICYIYYYTLPDFFLYLCQLYYNVACWAEKVTVRSSDVSKLTLLTLQYLSRCNIRASLVARLGKPFDLEGIYGYYVVAQLVESLYYKSEGCGFDYRWVSKLFIDCLLPATLRPCSLHKL